MLLWMACCLTAGEPAPLLQTGFDTDLTGWEKHGAATFEIDPAEHHAGDKSLRITIPPGTPLQWQQVDWPLGAVHQGDQFEATFWVLTHGLTDGSGAYGCIEFLDLADQRCGIEHSMVSLDNGSRGWQRLHIETTAPKNTVRASFNLILNSHGSAWFDDAEVKRTGRLEPWPDKGDAVRHVTIGDQVTQPKFAGVGFHVFAHSFPATRRELDEVILKRWREVGPTFARLNDDPKWDAAMLEQVAGWVAQFKRTNTEIYFTTWGPQETKPGAERQAYAKLTADRLEYFVKTKGLDNVRWYCMTNELSLKQWGSLRTDLETFADYQREMAAEFKRRGLKVGLLATDASPESWWDTIEWATGHMDDITAIYGGHHYFNQPPDDELCAPWFAKRLAWAVAVARAKGKDFILGEFGAKQDGRTLDGVKRDDCVWFGTPSEPLVALQLADTVIAALNAGVYAMGNWTFMDLPDLPFGGGYENKWGMFKRGGKAPNIDFATRAHYYGYGLLTKFARGPASVRAVTTDDPWLRAAALTHNGRDSATVIVLNRYRAAVPVRLALGTLPAARPWRRYLYDPAHVPQNAFGDLQPPDETLTARDGVLSDTLGPNCLAVYTTAYRDSAPAAVNGVSAVDGVVSWTASDDPQLCYYRVYADGQQIGSTIATHLADPRPAAGRRYRVVAVDTSGNTGP
jgi:hypothetical protein